MLFSIFLKIGAEICKIYSTNSSKYTVHLLLDANSQNHYTRKQIEATDEIINTITPKVISLSQLSTSISNVVLSILTSTDSTKLLTSIIKVIDIDKMQICGQQTWKNVKSSNTTYDYECIWQFLLDLASWVPQVDRCSLFVSWFAEKLASTCHWNRCKHKYENLIRQVGDRDRTGKVTLVSCSAGNARATLGIMDTKHSPMYIFAISKVWVAFIEVPRSIYMRRNA